MRSLWSLVLVAGLVGCQPAVVSPPAPAPVQVAGYTFGTLSVDQLQLLMRGGGPARTSVATPVVYGTFKAYQGAYSGHWGSSVFPGSFLPEPSLVATSLTGATGPGFSGTPESAIATVVRPLVQAWAPDAQLVKQYQSVPRATPGTDLEGLTDEASVIAKVGWPLSYTSPTRRENLAIWVEPGQTFVARTTWGPALATLPVSEAQAIAAVVAAVRDPAFKSVEEKTVKDAFLGTALTLGGPNEPKSSDFVAKVEPAYDEIITPDWLTMRMDVLGRPAWFVSLRNGRQVTEGPRVYLDQHVAGWVDAQTGEVLRFRRMFRETYRDDAAPIPGS